LHGVVLTDDYAWLRDKENPEVSAYLEAENAYAEAFMAPLAGLREELYQEMLSHVKQTDVTVPFLDRGWWYLTRTEEGRQYAILCRRRDKRVPQVSILRPGIPQVSKPVGAPSGGTSRTR
jgi:oligopeptidase B